MSALLEVDSISVSFDGFKAINNLSFNIGEAELRAVIGPNGAGKTTFMDIVTGKTRPDAGDVKWGTPPKSLLRMNEAQIAREGVGRKFQRPTVFEDQTVADNLTMALKASRNPFSVLGWRPSAASDDKVADLASEVGLAQQVGRKAGELSHGQKQWLEIGMLLAQEPRLLLVDEPAAGMTLAEREQTTALLVRLAQTRAVVVVEHDMDFVRRLNCKVTVLHQGSVLAEGSLDHVTRNPDVIEVYLGR
ncbi:urea ABC transporter ATP-binding protein UrtD [Paracoccus benzoatiresistens]|uniref:Urea ABC transporter ATP-binding protein UrtD n=1 Tax=Paracoccus benzoatiresistens TaxID=2997341 RepID=A0ABT4IZ25_9RHOB|nr:urea ABC transporter ATP-binding protein UrtD [Paracoccus sp. EF6]MCZ0960103.1 urea ABC transporter ATP-binding protein UrtD [Paracoccus sp. EF6]